MPVPPFRPAFALASALGFGLLAPAAAAAAAPLTTRYDVSLLGLPVGRATFATTIENDRFAVDGTIGSAGLADILSTVKGTSAAAGRIRGGRLVPDRFSLNYSSDKKTYRSDVAFRGGSVASARVQPEARSDAPGYVAVTPGQLRGAVDPLSGLMLKAKSADALCKRALPFFDGWSRLDLKLTPAGRRPFATDGFSGEAVACQARVVPVSGYRPTAKGVRFIAKQTLEIWFAPIGASGVYAPVYAKVPTEIGSLTFRAATFAKP